MNFIPRYAIVKRARARAGERSRLLDFRGPLIKIRDTFTIPSTARSFGIPSNYVNTPHNSANICIVLRKPNTSVLKTDPGRHVHFVSIDEGLPRVSRDRHGLPAPIIPVETTINRHIGRGGGALALT